MNIRQTKIFLSVLVLFLGVLACDLLATQPPVVYESPTPNQTDIALNALMQTIQPTLTALVLTDASTSVDTDAGVQAVEPTHTPQPPLPTNTPLPTYTPYPTYTLIPPPTNTAVPPNVGPGMRPGTSIAAAYIHTPPTINGDLSDWSLGIYPATSVVFGAGNHTGETDLSANVMVGWNLNYLYIGSRVKDDAYVQIATGAHLYKGDSIEILLDTNVSGDYYYDVLSNDDYQLGVSPGNPNAGTNPEAYLWYPSSVEGWRSQVQIGILPTANGYHIELAIPWSVFGISPYSGQHFGFAFSVSDNDLAGQAVQQTMVSNVSTRMLTHPMTWGDLTLTD